MTPRRRRRPPRARVVRRRLAALVVVVAALGALGWGATRIAADISEDDGRANTTTDTSTVKRRLPPRLRILRIIFPEGFTRKQMAERISAVNVIAREQRHVQPRLSPSEYLRLAADSNFPRTFGDRAARGRSRGFLFPALYEFTQKTRTKRLIRDQLAAFRANWSKVGLRYARSKNLTPYDVLVIASMIEEEAVVPRERRLIAAVIYNRLRRADAARDRRNDPVRARRAPHRAAPRLSPRERQPLQHAEVPRPASDADHEPRVGVDARGRAPGRVDYLYFVRKPDKRHHYFTASNADFLRKACEYGYGC